MSVAQWICIDASFALAAVLQDDHNHAAALKLLAQLAQTQTLFCSPAIFAYECDSVIRLRVHQKKMSDEEAQETRELVAALNVQIEYDAGDQDRAYAIATEYEQPRAYDATYAAHAESRGIELITTDKPFFESLNGDKRPTGAPALTWVRLLK